MRFYEHVDDQKRFAYLEARADEMPHPDDAKNLPVSDGISTAYALRQLREMAASYIIGELRDVPNPYNERNASGNRSGLRSDGGSSLEDKL